MSKLSKAVSEMKEVNSLRLDESVENFMGGTSYKLNPLETLKMVSASSIFGEPQYYRDGRTCKSGIYKLDTLFTVGESKEYIDDFILSHDEYKGKKTDEIMETLIDKALDYDFGATLDWATTLRKDYFMRLNPQVIMVRASLHPKREEFTKNNPGKFNEINQIVMSRADESMTQMSYYLFKNKGNKNNIPSVLKRSWAKHLSKLNRYKVAKYKNHEIGMIDAVRISHAHSDVIDELMTTGTIKVEDEDKTWENLRSSGMKWIDIFNTIDIPHMALLRNVRGVFIEIEDIDFCKKYLDKLKSGVKGGKQFPFRYWSALKAVESDRLVHHKPLIVDCLEECMDIAIDNYPKLKGKTMCLSDNSGSAWGSFNSEYGSVTVAEIDNLSSVITSACSDEGYVGKFGDNLKTIPISKRQGVLNQANKVTVGRDSDVGGSTEGGIWKFFYNAIEKKEHWDNIFIYSDMQAGHGGLYGTYADKSDYSRLGYECRHGYINVYKLIKDYRKKVNPKVNVFCVQTAGYDNVVIPEMAYRTAIMYGWTGKEAQFAQEYIKQWDDIESNINSKNNKQ